MHDDDLRTRLAAYADHDADAPPVEVLMGRADGRRRRRTVGVLGGVAAVTVAALWLPTQFRTPVPASPAPTASGTPSLSAPAPAPTLSCAEVREAWVGAFTGVDERPVGLPRGERLLRESAGTAVTQQGDGRESRLRVYPDGLGGPSTLVPQRDGTLAQAVLGIVEGRVALLELDGVSGTYRVVVSVLEPGTESLRQVAAFPHDPNATMTASTILRGDVLQWVAREGSSGGLRDVVVRELDLGRPEATPVEVARLRVPTSRWGDALLVNETHVLHREPGGGWAALDRRSLARMPLVGDPEYAGDGEPRASAGTFVLQVRYDGGVEETYVLDLLTGDERLVLKGEPKVARLYGNLMLAWDRQDVPSLVDMSTGRTLELPEVKGESGLFIGEDVGRAASVRDDDPGHRVPLSSLPTSFPDC